MPDPTKPDRFWRNLAILLIIIMAANISLGYLRKIPEPTDAPPMQVRQIVLAPNPKLDRVLLAVDFDEVNLEKALNDLMHQTDLNFAVQWTPINNLGVEKDVPVTVHLKNVSVATALDTVLSLADPKHQCAWNEHGGVVTIGTEDSIDKSQLTVRIYDVKHLIQKRIQHTGTPDPSLQNASQNQSGGGQNYFSGNQSQQQQSFYSPEQDELDQIKKLITDNVRPESWKDNGGDIGSISSFGDLLIITHAESAQLKIQAFLQLVDRQ